MAQSPYTVPVSKSVVDLSKSRAYGRGVEGPVVIGEDAPFVVELFNRLGTHIPTGGEKIQVKVQGPYGTVPVDFSDPGNGKYQVKYKPTDPGDHVISVSVKDQPIANSPFHVNVGLGANEVDPNQTVAYGPGLKGGNTAEPAVFTVETRNSKGEKIKTGGAMIAVDVQNADGVLIDSNIKDNNDGSYTVTYAPQDAGIHKVTKTIFQKKRFLRC